jgi:hypothetical protein
MVVSRLQQAYGSGRNMSITPSAGVHDSFGRLRIATTDTLFDSKMVHDNLPLFWDDAEVSGTGTTSTYDQDRAGVKLAVALNTAGKRVRQTFQHFNYQPGKSQLIYMTAVPVFSGGGAGITTSFGYFNDGNGVMFQTLEGIPNFTVRSFVTGSAVDDAIPQGEWNGDNLDGNGPSGIVFDPTKAQILWWDLEWLGVGTVRCGFVVDGQFIVCHQFNHANNINSVYMSHPNLPLRYEIENDGTGAATEMEHICATVISEGGQDERAQLHATSTLGIGITPAADVLAACIGIRLKAAQLNKTIDISQISMLDDGKTSFEWALYFNPVVAGTFVYSDVANSSVQVAIGAADGTNVLTVGTQVAGGVIASSIQAPGLVDAVIDSAIRLGSTIAGVPDTLVLACRPYGANAEIDAAMNWRERT